MASNYSEKQAYCETPATDVAAIPESVTNVSYEQDITFGLIGDLNGHLSDVLRPVPPTSDKAESLGRMAQSPLHGRVNELVSRQESINAGLRSLIERLTV